MILSNEVYPKWRLENALRGVWGRRSRGCGAVTGDKSQRAQAEVQIPYGKVLVKTGVSSHKARHGRAGGI